MSVNSQRRQKEKEPSAKRKKPSKAPPKTNAKPDVGLFVGIAAFAGSVVLFILQENGRNEINWVISAVLYLVCACIISWSFWTHVRLKHVWTRTSCALAITIFISSLGCWGTINQFRKDNLVKATLPKTLYDLFKKDFSLVGYGGKARIHRNVNGTEESTNLEFMVWYDTSSHTKFLSVYVPPVSYYLDILNFIPSCYNSFFDAPMDSVALPDFPSPPEGFRVELKIDNTTNQMKPEFRIKYPSDNAEVKSKEMTASGVIYVYLDEYLTLGQLGAMDDLYKSKHLFPQFRGKDYFLNRMGELRRTNH